MNHTTFSATPLPTQHEKNYRNTAIPKLVFPSVPSWRAMVSSRRGTTSPFIICLPSYLLQKLWFWLLQLKREGFFLSPSPHSYRKEALTWPQRTDNTGTFFIIISQLIYKAKILKLERQATKNRIYDYLSLLCAHFQ